MPTAGATKLQIATVAILLVLLIGLTLAWFSLPVKEWIQSFIGWIRELGAWGVVLFAIAYVLLVVVLAPAEIMTIAAGLIFGAWGFPLVVVSATVGAVLAFLVSRYVARTLVNELMHKRPLFKAVDTAIEEEGWKTVLLLRLNPLVPFNLQNYFFGATNIGLLPYMAATFFGIMPGTAAYVYLGTLGQLAANEGASGGLKIGLLAGGLLATAALIWLVGRRARAGLKTYGIDKTGA